MAGIILGAGINNWLQSRRELRNLRRQKLEQMLVALHSIDDWIEKERIDGMNRDRVTASTPCPFDIVEAIVSLYFPQLDRITSQSKIAVIKISKWLAESAFEWGTLNLQVKMGKEADAGAVRERLVSSYEPLYKAYLETKSQLAEAARKIARQM